MMDSQGETPTALPKNEPVSPVGAIPARVAMPIPKVATAGPQGPAGPVLRSASRDWFSPSRRGDYLGFRVARTLSSTAPVASPAAAKAFGPYNPGNLVDESDPYRTILSGSCKTLTVTTSLSVRRMPLKDVIDMTALPNGDGSARVTSNCRDGRACVTIETPEEKLGPEPDLSVLFIDSGLADEYVGKVDMLKNACGLAR
jgi:hypothetical protein